MLLFTHKMHLVGTSFYSSNSPVSSIFKSLFRNNSYSEIFKIFPYALSLRDNFILFAFAYIIYLEYIYVFSVRLLLLFSHQVQLFVTPWTTARQPPLSIEFSGQKYWNGLSKRTCIPLSPAWQMDLYHWANWEALSVR